MPSAKTLKTCARGHQFYKSSTCPVCPICEAARKPNDSFLALLSAPARRGLENAQILALETLSKYSEEEILKLHGIGPSTIPKLKEALQAKGLSFRN